MENNILIPANTLISCESDLVAICDQFRRGVPPLHGASTYWSRLLSFTSDPGDNAHSTIYNTRHRRWLIGWCSPLNLVRLRRTL
jgi:hypothetical protein